ncbi:MAG: efflux RND transporter periplasmic adaptor subunit [Gemmatimonadaceae bacterium]
MAVSTGAALLLVLLVWGFARRRDAGDGGGDAADKPLAQSSRVHVVDGEATVEMDSAARRRAGIVVIPAAASTAVGAIGYGSVISLDTLSALHNAYVAAQTAIEGAVARADASRREYERLAALQRDQQNASAKAVEAARANMLSARAAVTAANAPGRTLAAAARQDWGAVVGDWIIKGSPEFDRLLSGAEALVRVSVPFDVPMDATAPTARLETAPGTGAIARYVSAAARSDPRIEGRTYYYLAPASPTLLPGMNVTAVLAGRHATRGAAVPDSAIVWTDGAPWVYVRTGPSTFARRRVTTGVPASAGGYLVPAITPGTPIVVRGAQVLLSEELRSQIQGGGD